VKAPVQIFLSYARPDEEEVENLYQKLSNKGFKPWMDKRDILPGERWPSSIQEAIRRSDFFLACLSKNSVDKRGWIQREIREALDILQGMLDSDIYLIPVRLEACEVLERLRDFQWVNLFEENGWARLMKAIQIGIKRRKESADVEPIGDIWPQFVNLADAVVILDPERSKKVIDPLKEKLSKALNLINGESKPEEWVSLVDAVSDFYQYSSSTEANRTIEKLRQLVVELVSKIIDQLSNYEHLASITEQLNAMVRQLQHL